MNPNNQQPAMSPQMPPQGLQSAMVPGPPAMPQNPQQAAMQNQPKGKGGKAQMPSQPFTAAHNHVFNQLRDTLMSLVQQGIPGMEDVLTALNNSHVNGLKSTAQAPQMPQQGGGQQIPPQVLAQLLQGGGGQPSPSAQMQSPQMPQGGQ